MKKLLILTGLLIACLMLFAGCGEEWDPYEGQVKVVYELEGGTYKNCTGAITQYYAFPAGEHPIVAPDTMSQKPIEKPDHYIEGWYTSRVESGGEVSYEGKWDFANDKVGAEGITLYANWVKRITYTYEVCYRVGDEIKVINKYPVEAGETFEDYAGFAEKRSGYTHLGTFRDEAGNPWDPNFTHPGGDESLAIRVFPDYMEGEYVLIRNAADFKSANKTANLYLLDDIDLGGANFAGFNNYSGIFKGNGHKIYNFTLLRDFGKNSILADPDLTENNEKILSIALFRSLNKATLENIEFSDFTVELGVGLPANTDLVMVAPLAVKISGSTLTNVKVSGTYYFGEKWGDYDMTKTTITEDGPAHLVKTTPASTLTDVTVAFTKVDPPAEQDAE